MNDDIKSAFGFAARVAINQSLSIDDLSDMLRVEYEEAERSGKQKDASKSKIQGAKVGGFVMYVCEQKGPLTAHVLEILGDNKLNLRVHQTAQPDFDRKDVPFSAKLKKSHWSYR